MMIRILLWSFAIGAIVFWFPVVAVIIGIVWVLTNRERMFR